MTQTKDFLDGERIWEALGGETAETPMRWVPAGANRAVRRAWAGHMLAEMVLLAGGEPVIHGQVTRPDEERGVVLALTETWLLVSEVASFETDKSDVTTTAIPRTQISAVQISTSSPLREEEFISRADEAKASPLKSAHAKLQVWLHVPPHGVFELSGEGASSEGQRTPLSNLLDALLAGLRG